MELSDYIRVLRKNWLVIVAITLIGLGAAAGYSLTRTPMYQAEATVFVSTQQGNTVQELQQGSTFTQARVTTYTKLVTQQTVLQKTIDRLQLNTSVDSLASHITATNALNTTLIQIAATDESPQRAADIANAVSESLTETVPEIEPSTASG
ncbi:chromosome partitioning protein, partial [Ralstonia pickettii]|uniref:YveK family protein n=2 Tax=Bacteria TaxID=2 RepID=UPI000D2907BC